MISSLTLTNFQAHKETKLQLHPGVNCLVGSSDNGKSSIIRGILWAYTNRPLGDSYVSYWNRTKKDTIAGETSIELSFDNGSMKRIKTPDRNGYDVGELELGAIGSDIPEEVVSLFNITDLNISGQHDKPFLLSESAGDVAKYLNKLVKLDKIDTVLAAVESKKREIRKGAESAEKAIAQCTKDLEKYVWIEEGEKLYTKISSCSDAREQDTVQLGSLEAALGVAISAHAKVEQEAEARVVIKKCESLGEEIEAVSAKYNALLQKQNTSALEEAVSSIHIASDTLRVFPVLPLDLMQEIDIVGVKMEDNQKSLATVEDVVVKLKGHTDTIEQLRAKIDEALKELPDACPSCGRPMEADECSE